MLCWWTGFQSFSTSNGEPSLYPAPFQRADFFFSGSAAVGFLHCPQATVFVAFSLADEGFCSVGKVGKGMWTSAYCPAPPSAPQGNLLRILVVFQGSPWWGPGGKAFEKGDLSCLPIGS